MEGMKYLINKNIKYNHEFDSVSSTTNSRFSTPGIRSLPLTPPAPIERGTAVAISCPDGLGHALSEENIRLQQIVYEHKVNFLLCCIFFCFLFKNSILDSRRCLTTRIAWNAYGIVKKNLSKL